VVLLHVGIIVAFSQYAPARAAFRAAVPLTVSLISPEVPEAPKPRLKQPTKPPVKPHLASPTPITEVPPPIVAPSVAVTESITLPVTPPPPERVATVSEPAPPPPVAPPRFDADYLQNPAPAYSAVSRRLREQGRVVLRVLVSADGRPEKVELRASSGFERLDTAALDTVAHWRFVPARQGDRPIAGWVLVPISFSLAA
jgi:protein TonB